MNGDVKSDSVLVGTAPDSWGVWFAHDRKQIPWARFLDEVAEAGYAWIELGPYGYLPTDAERLAPELEARGLGVSAGTVVFALEDEAAWERVRADVERTCALVGDLGANYLVLIDDTYTDLLTGELKAPRDLDEAGWAAVATTTLRVAELAARHGLTVALHPHAESHIEFESQIERFLDITDGHVGLCLDVGHHAYTGGNPISFFLQHHGRITYLHLKSVDDDVRRRVKAERVPFAGAVAMDVFVEPAFGRVDFVQLQAALADVGYSGFAIVEQDMYPAPLDKPLPIAKRTRAYLREIGLG